MNVGLKIVIASLVAAMLIPVLHFQALYDVDVTWSIRETTPKDHAVTFKNQTFVIPKGGSVTRAHRLRGGGSAALLYSIRGWGFRSNQLFLEGEQLPLSRISQSHERGCLRILGIGLKPSMKVLISLD